jgi:hypothetical protein
MYTDSMAICLPPRFTLSAREIRATRAVVGVQGSRVALLDGENDETDVPLSTRVRA